MKILLGSYVLESNAFISKKTTLDDFKLVFHDEVLDLMPVTSYLQEKGIEVKGIAYADAGNQGVLVKEEFLKMEEDWLKVIKQEKDIDGLLLHLHGASEVEEIGSGEAHLLDEIRKLVGEQMPIVVVCDPHGNLCRSYTDQMNALLSYRESPHTDRLETMEKGADLLVRLIKEKKTTKVIYRPLDMLLGGEMSVSGDEPVVSINKLLDEYEKDERILRCNWHVGYIRHDTEIAGCSISVVPSSYSNESHANMVADELATYVWDRRRDFHFTGTAAKVDEALEMVRKRKEKPCFITDSGDNVTAGALGVNTFLLKSILAEKTDQQYLFSSICDKKAFALLSKYEIGSQISLDLGEGIDELSSPIHLEVSIISFGKQKHTKIFGESGTIGDHVLIKIKDKSVYVIVANTSQPYVEEEQIKDLGISWNDYDIIVVKCGYAFPEMLEHFCVMALTDGATLQEVKRLPFKKVRRPIFPLDDI